MHFTLEVSASVLLRPLWSKATRVDAHLDETSSVKATHNYNI